MLKKKNPTYFRLTALSLTVITSLGQTPPPSVAHLHQISNDCLITAFFPLCIARFCDNEIWVCGIIIILI